MPRFTVKRILASMTVVAVGVSLVGYVYRSSPLAETEIGFYVAVASLGFALVGCGALIPFNRPILGVLLGLLVMIALLFR